MRANPIIIIISYSVPKAAVTKVAVSHFTAWTQLLAAVG